MPKLPLNAPDLRSLAAQAVRAARHPVTTGQEAVSTARSVAATFVAKARDLQSSTTSPTTPTAPTEDHEPPGPVAVTPEAASAPPATPTPAAPAAPPAPAAQEPPPEAPAMSAEPRRTGPAPHLSRMPRDIERDVEAELEDSEAAGGASATYEPEDPGHEPDQPGTDDIADPGIAKSVRKESTRAARASDTKKS